MKKATTKTKAISFLGMNGLSIPIEKTNIINIINKTISKELAEKFNSGKGYLCL